MSQKRTVTEFLRKIREEYEKAREEYTSLSDRIELYEQDKARELNNINATMEEKTYIKVKYDKLINAKKEEIRELIKNSYAKFDEIKADWEKVFDRVVRPTGEQLDINTIELLKSGILRAEEIEALAKDFDGNCAMMRIIGQYAFEEGERTENADLRRLGSKLKHTGFKFKEPVDTLIFWSQQGLREDRVLSDGIAKRYDEQADKIFAAAEGIFVEVE